MGANVVFLVFIFSWTIVNYIAVQSAQSRCSHFCRLVSQSVDVKANDCSARMLPTSSLYLGGPWERTCLHLCLQDWYLLEKWNYKIDLCWCQEVLKSALFNTMDFPPPLWNTFAHGEVRDYGAGRHPRLYGTISPQCKLFFMQVIIDKWYPNSSKIKFYLIFQLFSPNSFKRHVHLVVFSLHYIPLYFLSEGKRPSGDLEGKLGVWEAINHIWWFDALMGGHQGHFYDS